MFKVFNKKVIKNLAFISIAKRNNTIWSVDKVVNSKFKDIVVPNVTLSEYLWNGLDKWSSKTAVVCSVTKRQYTYEEMYRKSRIFGVQLRKQFKIQNGDSVAVMMSNVPEFPISVFGILAAGGVVALMNPIYTLYEVNQLLKIANAKLFVVTPEAVEVVRAALKRSNKYTQTPIISIDIDQRPDNTISFKELTEDKNIDLDVLKHVYRKPDDVAFLPFSSGTTGLPKAVELTNTNIIANCEQQNTECRQYDYTTDSNQDTVLGALPLFHSFGLSILMTHKLSVGLQIVMMPKFNSDYLLYALSQFEINLMYLVPPMALLIGSHPQIKPELFRKLKVVTLGGAPLLQADGDNFKEKIGRDVYLSQAYGLTETSPLATMNPVGYENRKSVGFAIPNVKLRVVDSLMNNLGPNEVGELLIKGPNVMRGYKDNPEANKEVFIGDKWFRSGDLARIDKDGSVYIVGRLKELIKVNAYQVPPAELETVLKDHPDVFDVAVIGVPDDKTGEKPKAFVVLKNGATTKEKEIIDFVAERVAHYKKVKEVSFVDSIPKNLSGKILRKVLKEQNNQKQ